MASPAPVKCSALAALHLGAGLLLPLLLSHCQTTSYGHYKKIDIPPEKLATPSGHGMTKKDYPFDDQGKYRKDWVKTKPSSRTRSSYRNAPAPPSAPAEAPGGNTGEAGSSERFAGTVDGELEPVGQSAGASLADSSAPASSVSGSPAEPAPAQLPTYHRVSSGDTLFSISQKYGTDPAALKRANGLSSDQILVGQSLRIP